MLVPFQNGINKGAIRLLIIQKGEKLSLGALWVLLLCRTQTGVVVAAI